MSSLLSAIRDHEPAADFLLWPGDFDLDRADRVEQARLASGERLQALAGDGSGGTYFFCGDGGEERPILYADSEGGAALVAIGLTELVLLLLTVPWWRDCTDFTVEESREAAEEHLEDEPDLLEQRDAVASALGLALPTEEQAWARIREVATGPGRDYVLLNALEGTPYRALLSSPRWSGTPGALRHMPLRCRGSTSR
ncbi:hypothetical protein AB0D04_04305 [Streptomyces sp. NPDC048483]|uniref:hypothetical protein n=1 Tax=Streptomyces sp. NPDC048483 TaxID=3154927 RepID=UPI00342093E5